MILALQRAAEMGRQMLVDQYGLSVADNILTGELQPNFVVQKAFRHFLVTVRIWVLIDHQLSTPKEFGSSICQAGPWNFPGVPPLSDVIFVSQWVSNTI